MWRSPSGQQQLRGEPVHGAHASRPMAICVNGFLGPIHPAERPSTTGRTSCLDNDTSSRAPGPRAARGHGRPHLLHAWGQRSAPPTPTMWRAGRAIDVLFYGPRAPSMAARSPLRRRHPRRCHPFHPALPAPPTPRALEASPGPPSHGGRCTGGRSNVGRMARDDRRQGSWRRRLVLLAVAAGALALADRARRGASGSDGTRERQPLSLDRWPEVPRAPAKPEGPQAAS